ncbi:MAG TPA: type VI secretion system Vgr family protein, partial [Thiobacillus sp.]
MEYAHGDIDRPVIVGAVYNGEGAADQTGNTQPGGVGATTGNAPLWFNGNGHANHLSGIVTQTLADSQSGAAQRYNQLALDDTPQQSRLELFTTQAETQLQ